MALPYDLARCRNEIWGGIPRGSFFATFAFFAAKTPESSRVVYRRVGRRFLRDLHGYNMCGAAKRLFPGGS